jgi:Skp family chaperone for outer membrane proteins
MKMKKRIPLLCLSIFLSWSLTAQKTNQSREKIKSLKIAYLTEQLNLTSKEAEVFWPIYNAHDEKINALRFAIRKNLKNLREQFLDPNSVSEKKAKSSIDFKLKTDKKILQEQNEFIGKITKILGYKKTIQLQFAEMEFGRNLMRKYKQRRRN